MIRVLHTIEGMGASFGGLATCTFDLLTALQDKSEFQCDLLTLGLHPDNAGDTILGDGSSWIKYEKFDGISPLTYSSAVRNFLRCNSYDLYHINGLWQYINHKACAVARRQNKPYVITPHGMLYPETLSRSKWKKHVILSIWHHHDIQSASCIHCTCEQEMINVRNLGYNGPIAVIGNPVSMPDYIDEILSHRIQILTRLASTQSSKSAKIGNTKLKVGFLGRLHPRKHPELIIQAAALCKNIPVDIYIIGDGDDGFIQFLHKQAVSSGLEDSVHFLGFVNGRRKYELLSELDALFVPSDMENFGMIIAESLIVGTPVFASCGTPWRSLEQYNCGWWREATAENISKTIQEISELSVFDKIKMAENGSKLIKNNFAPCHIADQMAQLYRWLLGCEHKPDFVYC